MANNDGSEIHMPSYETGYANGESSGYADWIMQLSEDLDMPDFDGPQEFLKKLREAYDLVPKAPAVME